MGGNPADLDGSSTARGALSAVAVIGALPPLLEHRGARGGLGTLRPGAFRLLATRQGSPQDVAGSARTLEGKEEVRRRPSTSVPSARRPCWMGVDGNGTALASRFPRAHRAPRRHPPGPGWAGGKGRGSRALPSFRRLGGCLFPYEGSLPGSSPLSLRVWGVLVGGAGGRSRAERVVVEGGIGRIRPRGIPGRRTPGEVGGCSFASAGA